MDEIKAWCESGADVNHRNGLGLTALMAGARNGDLKMVKLLVSYGAHINLKDNHHFSALHYATLGNNLDIIKYLIENGALLTDAIYMSSIHKNYKEITLYFDTLDESKKILQKK